MQQHTSISGDTSYASAHASVAPVDSAALRDALAGVLHDRKAEDVLVIDLHGKTDIADYMIIASGTSQRHVSALAEHAATQLKELGVPLLAMEGKTTGDWVLLDAGDVIVHLFRPEVRSFYNLEKMWMVDTVEPDSTQKPGASPPTSSTSERTHAAASAAHSATDTTE